MLNPSYFWTTTTFSSPPYITWDISMPERRQEPIRTLPKERLRTITVGGKRREVITPTQKERKISRLAIDKIIKLCGAQVYSTPHFYGLKGRGVVDCIERHFENGRVPVMFYLLDFVRFYPSVTSIMLLSGYSKFESRLDFWFQRKKPRAVFRHFQALLKYNTVESVLATGGVGSAFLAHFVLCELDHFMNNGRTLNYGAYSRYCDNIMFSFTEDELKEMLQCGYIIPGSASTLVEKVKLMMNNDMLNTMRKLYIDSLKFRDDCRWLPRRILGIYVKPDGIYFPSRLRLQLLSGKASKNILSRARHFVAAVGKREKYAKMKKKVMRAIKQFKNN